MDGALTISFRADDVHWTRHIPLPYDLVMTRKRDANDKPSGVLVGYARVSTAEQNLALQREALLAAGVEPDRIHVDTASGVSKTRPGLAAALLDCVEGDTLMVWKLDRLGRSMLDLLNHMQDLEQRGIRFRSLTEGIDTSNLMGRLLLHLLGALTEFERGLIKERTMAGIATARAEGKVWGPKRKFDEAETDEMFASGMGHAEVTKRLGLSRNALYKYYPAERVEKLRKNWKRRKARS